MSDTLATPLGGNISPLVVLYVIDGVFTFCLGLLGFYVSFLTKYVDDLLLAVPGILIYAKE